MDEPSQAMGYPRWQFGITQLFQSAALVALSLGTFRLLFVTLRYVHLWEFVAGMMFAAGWMFAALGLLLGRKFAIFAFAAGAGVGAWATWRMMTTGL